MQTINSRTISAGSTTLSPTDFNVKVDTNSGSVTMILPKIATVLETLNKMGVEHKGISFKDISNNASVNNITIQAFDENTINGEASFVLSTNGIGGHIFLSSEDSWGYIQTEVPSGRVDVGMGDGGEIGGEIGGLL